ncbi:MAG TPA: PRC-barrel domain-containing protein [Candidatus Binatia bacterium]|nr:PRC-barrel domain-containing protein [Candidatus Binatia bacterium]
MLRAVDELKSFALGADDGEIGKVIDSYFDDEKWTVRYLIVDTGGWLTGRQVLISPMSISKVDWHANRINVRLTKKQVEDSPSIEEDKPVSRQHEMDYFTYYNYPYYWTGPYVWGPASMPGHAIAPRPQNSQAREILEMKQASEDVHLRSIREVTGYYIGAKDGDIGHAEKFILDDENWTLRYMVVDTRNWLPGKKVLVSPEWISSVSWSDGRVYVDLTRDAIKSCPEYDPDQPIDRGYESRLHEHYQRPRYWKP